MHHLIFIPAEHLSGQTVAEQLAAVGLEDHAQGALPVKCVGPAGGGMLFGWVPGKLHYNATEQDWYRAEPHHDLPGGRLWVGTWKDSPVTPNDVQRPGRDAWGEPFQIGGNQWLIPPIDLLPRLIAQMPDGSSGLRVKPEYADLTEEHARWAARLTGGPTMVPLVEMAAFVTWAMSINYRLSLPVSLHLGLFDEDNIKDAIKLVLRSRAFYASREAE